jgi:transcriptional regulator with XRE-family HTH domain
MVKLNRVQELRKAKNMTKRELSRKSNVSVYLINRIEKEEIFPLQTTMLKLCYALGERMDYVFNFDSDLLSDTEIMSKKSQNQKKSELLKLLSL